MAKKCPITLNNDAVTCFLYDDVEVQVPPIGHLNATHVYVDHKDGKYIVVDENKKDKFETAKEDEKAVHKTDEAKDLKPFFKH